MQINELVKAVSKETGEHGEIVEEIIRSQFKFVLDHCRERNAKAINIIHLGKIYKNKKHLKCDDSIRGDMERMEERSI